MTSQTSKGEHLSTVTYFCQAKKQDMICYAAYLWKENISQTIQSVTVSKTNTANNKSKVILHKATVNLNCS